jgi:hypothetical protein
MGWGVRVVGAGDACPLWASAPRDSNMSGLVQPLQQRESEVGLPAKVHFQSPSMWGGAGSEPVAVALTATPTAWVTQAQHDANGRKHARLKP